MKSTSSSVLSTGIVGSFKFSRPRCLANADRMIFGMMIPCSSKIGANVSRMAIAFRFVCLLRLLIGLPLTYHWSPRHLTRPE